MASAGNLLERQTALSSIDDVTMRADFGSGAPSDEAEEEFTDRSAIGPSFTNAVNSLIAYALTCRSDRADWLKEMARLINKVATQLGDPDRAEFDGQDGLHVVQKTEDKESD